MKLYLKLITVLLMFSIALCFVSCKKRELDNGIEYYSSSDYYGVLDITFYAGEHVEIPSEHNGHKVTVLNERDSYRWDSFSTYKTLILPETIERIVDDFYYEASKSLQYNEYDNGLYLGTKDNPYFAFIKVKNVENPTEMSYVLDAGIDDPEKEGLPPPAYVENPTDATSCVIHPDTKIIANNAFAGCEKLKSITIPGTIKVIPTIAFGGCTSLETIIIEEGVEIIRGGAFLDCHKLTSIVLPSSIKECEGVFSELYNIENVVLPSTWTTVPEGMFENCYSLKKIELPEGLTEIGAGAFEGCKSLEEINFPSSLEIINRLAFKDCTALEKVNLPDQLTVIDLGAFWGCSSIKSIELPDSLREIGGAAFAECSLLTNIHIPKNVEKIESSIIRDCPLVADITVDPENKYFCAENGALYDIEMKNLIAYAPAYQAEAFVIPESVQEIWANAFGGSVLSEITIPEGVKIIDTLAFANMPNLKYLVIPDSVHSIGQRIIHVSTSLERLVIGKGITKIKDISLGECCVKEIYISSSIKEIDNEVFKGLMGLENIIVDEANRVYKSLDGNLYSKDGKTFIKYAHGKKDKEFTVPSGVIAIGTYAFSKIDTLENVVIPSSVKTIKEYAFSNGFGDRTSTSLLSVVIPEGVVSIGDGAFFYCENLKSVIIPDSVTLLDVRAFANCSSLKSVKIGKGVKIIEGNTFQHCTSLTSIELGENTERIESYSFSGCTSLADIKIPKSVKVIEKNAFMQTMNFHYDGTKSEWYALQKNSELFSRLGKVNKHYVYCSNGKMTIVGSD